MKKALSLFLVAVMLLTFVACGKETGSKTEEPNVSYDSSTLDGIKEGITADYTATTELLTSEWEKVRTTIGDTYDGYSKHKQDLLDWYDLVHQQTTALYSRTNEKVVAYYKLVADTIDHDDDDALEEATDNIYDAVYEDNFDDLYDTVYEDIFDDIYDEYYEGIIDDAEDSMEYGDWLDVRSDFYGTWLDKRSEFYGEWLDARSNFYSTWLDMRSAFRSGNFDVDSVIADNNADESNKDNNQGSETTKPSTSEDGPSLDATPVDGTEHEADGFKYVVLSDGTIELTKYIGSDSSVTISSEIDDYEVSRIGASAFEGCSKIEDIIMWPDVISIGKAAFKGCSSLEEFSIPSSVTVINDSVFENCTSLESIIIWGDITSIGEAAFKNCTSLEDVSIPSSCLMIGKSAFEGCSDMEDVIFWGGEKIGDRAFMNCSSLKDISLPSEVTSVGQSAFEGCTSLESVIVWGDDVVFGVNAFANCPKLKDLPDGAVNDSSISTDSNNTSSTAGIRPEFKEAMDSYEAFFDEYVAIMKKYKANPTDLSILTDYATYMGQYADMMQKFEAWENEDLNKEELAYYIDVQARITKKLLEVA